MVEGSIGNVVIPSALASVRDVFNKRYISRTTKSQLKFSLWTTVQHPRSQAIVKSECVSASKFVARLTAFPLLRLLLGNMIPETGNTVFLQERHKRRVIRMVRIGNCEWIALE